MAIPLCNQGTEPGLQAIWRFLHHAAKLSLIRTAAWNNTAANLCRVPTVHVQLEHMFPFCFHAIQVIDGRTQGLVTCDWQEKLLNFLTF
jgi:hypothetical protein